MREIRFAEWTEVLAQANLTEQQKRSWAITLRWYLSFCGRGRAGVTVQSARDFIEWAQREKQAQPWQVEEWKEAIRWFFRAAKVSVDGAKAGPLATKTGQGTSNTQHPTSNIRHRTSNVMETEGAGRGRLPPGRGPI